jgi:pyrroloquinoline quinone (PQQ) biosynthesis protein C
MTKRYRIGLTQSVFEETTVEIEADDAETAERLALAKAVAGDVQWHFLDTVMESTEVCSTEEMITSTTAGGNDMTREFDH